MEITLRLQGEFRWRGTVVRSDQLHRLLSTLVAAHPWEAPTERLIETLWPEQRPAHPAKALQILVSRARAATAPDVVRRTASGYRLGLESGEVDVLAREELTRAAQRALQSGEITEAAEQARQALALGSDGRARRVAALTGQMLGQHEAALPELEAVAEDLPEDEQVLAALVRSVAAVRGTTAALLRYESIHRDFVSEVGAEPGPALKRVQRELLAADRPHQYGLRHAATSLLGRARDVETITGLLGSARLLSIVGPGGLGKTRLAQELAQRSSQPAVYVVELAGIAAPADVPATVATALNSRGSVTQRDREADQRSVLARLVAQLQQAPSLLILDNCEHLVDAVADLVAFLLSQVGDLRILTTSRTPLQLTAERLYPLEQLSTGVATELFRQRALAVRPTAKLDKEEITQVLERLDGLPLAIELAAAQVRIMSVEAIRDGLDDRFALLHGGDRSVPDRHRTLEAVIDWSWRLLDSRDQEALMFLSILPDGFTAESAGQMLQRAGADVVRALADQSLVAVDERAGRLRYRMLETVREFGQLRLAALGLESAAHERKRSWAVRLSRPLVVQVHAEQLAAVDVLRREETNLTDVLREGLAAGDTGIIPVLAALVSYWSVNGNHVRNVRLLAPVDGLLEGWSPSADLLEETRVAVALLMTTAALAPQRPEIAEIRRVMAEAGPDSELPFVRALCEVVQAFNPSWGSMQSTYDVERLRALAQSTNRFTAMIAGIFSAGAAENEGEIGAAIELMRTGLARARPDDPPWLGATYRLTLAQLHTQAGRYEQAADYAHSVLPLMQRLGATNDVLLCRLILAGAALARGDLDTAEEEFASMGQLQGHGDGSVDRLPVLLGQAEIAWARGEADRGEELLNRALEAHGPSALWHGAEAGSEAEVLNPWLLVSYAAAVAIHTRYDNSADDHLWPLLYDRALAASAPGRSHYDYPVLGTAAFALAWGAVRHRRLDASHAAALFALAERMGYNRFLPSLQWEPAIAELPGDSPNELAYHRADLRDRAVQELVPLLHELLRLTAPADSCAPPAGQTQQRSLRTRGQPNPPRW